MFVGTTRGAIAKCSLPNSSTFTSDQLIKLLPLGGKPAKTRGMTTRQAMQWFTLLSAVLSSFPVTGAEQPRFAAELIFPLHYQHNHAPAIVECPNSELLVSWYRGSG